MWSRVVIVAAVVSSVCSVHIPKVLEVNPCRVTDKLCILKIWKSFMAVIVAGLEEYEDKIMDPYFLERIDYDFPEYDISEEILNATIVGLRCTVLEDFHYNREPKSILYTYLLNFRLEGNSTTTYHVKPELKRAGPFMVWFQNLTMVVRHDFTHQMMNGRKYLQLLTTNVTELRMPHPPIYEDLSPQDTEHLMENFEVIRPILSKLTSNRFEYYKKFALGLAEAIAELITYNHKQFSKRIPVEEYYIE